MVGLFHDVLTVVVVVVVDSVELELEEEYPDGDTEGGVTLLYGGGKGDGVRSMIWRRFAGVGFLFLTGLKAYSFCVSSTG